MAYFTGQTGSVYYAATAGSTPTQKIAKVRSWSFQSNVNTSETTALGDYAATNVATIKGGSGSAEIFYYTLEAGEEGTTASSVLSKVFKTGAMSSSDRVSLELRIDNTRYLRFNAWITSADIGTSTGEVTRASISFTMDGDYTAVVL